LARFRRNHSNFAKLLCPPLTALAKSQIVAADLQIDLRICGNFLYIMRDNSMNRFSSAFVFLTAIKASQTIDVYFAAD